MSLPADGVKQPLDVNVSDFDLIFLSAALSSSLLDSVGGAWESGIDAQSQFGNPDADDTTVLAEGRQTGTITLIMIQENMPIKIEWIIIFKKANQQKEMHISPEFCTYYTFQSLRLD